MDLQRLELIAQTERVERLEELYDLVKSLCKIFSVKHAVYHSIQWRGEPFAFATYSFEWHQYYEQNRLYLVDPVVLAAFQMFQPYNWKSLEWDRKPARQLMAAAAEHGVGNQGLSMPVRGPNGELALLSVSSDATDEEWDAFVSSSRADLLLIGHFIHEAARRLILDRKELDYAHLSPREVDALSMLGLGMNRSQIAENLKISEHTLRVYIESSRQKLGASNTTHAVASALTRGLIAF